MPKTAELIAAALRRQIIRGELGPQAVLPPEPALMTQFGVSRPTLREAFRVLEAESLISVRRGARGGAQVNAPDPAVAARYAGLILEYRGASLDDVRQARVLIEPSCARLLAQGRGAAGLARLRSALDAEHRARHDPQALAAAQDRFHTLLAELAGNQTLSLLSGVLRHIAEHSGAPGPGRREAVDKAQAARAYWAHARLLDLAGAGLAAEAEALWRRHCAADDDLAGVAAAAGAARLESTR